MNKEMVNVNKSKGLEVDEDMFNVINENSSRVSLELKYFDACRERDNYKYKLHRLERRIERKKKARRELVLNTLTFIGCVMLAWMFISWVNVICNNTTPGGYERIWDWNFFKMMTQMFQK